MPVRVSITLLTTAEVATMAGVSQRWIEQLIASGELPSIDLGDRRLLDPIQVAHFLIARSKERQRPVAEFCGDPVITTLAAGVAALDAAN